MSGIYNLTNFTHVNGLFDIVNASNQVTGGILVSGFMIGLFAVIFVSFSRYGFAKSFLVTNFLSFIISCFLFPLGLLSFIYPLVFLVFTGFSYWLLNSKGDM